MTKPDPDLTIIRTALRMSRTLANAYAYGGLRYFYDCQVDAIAALDRVEERGKAKQLSFLTTPSTPLTELDVQAATCHT